MILRYIGERNMSKNLEDFIDLEVEKAREKYELGNDSRDWQIILAQKDVRSFE